MSDVFISYSSLDRARAQELAEALGRRGLSVWWDREIGTGQAFDAVIERELDGARCVVVLWSRHAVASEWVKNEAAAAAERGVLLPAQLDPTRPPLEFRRRQTADLSDWRPDTLAHPGFDALCRAIDAVRGSPAPDRGDVPSPLPPSPTPTTRPKGLALAGIAAALIAAVAIGVSFLPRSAGHALPEAATAPPRSPPPAGSANRESTAGPVESGVAPIGGGKEARADGPSGATVGLADRVAGRYAGTIVSDSQGPSGRRLVVTLEKAGADAVIVRSPYKRIDDLRITLTEASSTIMNLDGDTPFIVHAEKTPMELSLTPRNELAFHGVRQ